MFFTLMRGVIVLVPAFYVMPVVFPEWGIWGAIPVSEAVTLAAVIATYMISHHKIAEDVSKLPK